MLKNSLYLILMMLTRYIPSVDGNYAITFKKKRGEEKKNLTVFSKITPEIITAVFNLKKKSCNHSKSLCSQSKEILKRFCKKRNRKQLQRQPQLSDWSRRGQRSSVGGRRERKGDERDNRGARTSSRREQTRRDDDGTEVRRRE